MSLVFLKQHCSVDDHQLELKISERATRYDLLQKYKKFVIKESNHFLYSYKMLTVMHVFRSTEVTHKKKQADKKQTGSKILVRNVPFQATVKEIRELFWYSSVFLQFNSIL